MATEGCRIAIRGTVQGVGFRPWVYRVARALGIGGSVRNDGGGVTIEAFAPVDRLDRFVIELRTAAPPAARIVSIETMSIKSRAVADFSIVASAAGDQRRVSIPADLTTCADCLHELLDPADRRFRYPFINCTNCGPRFTIALDVPYDRPATTMSSFRMCVACQREYDDPDNRRFHAQPNACPECGPQLRLLGSTGDPLAETERVLREGGVVAIKGVGGYHLVCDASSPAAVRELRRRKHRDAKPFAIMVPDLAAAEHIAVVSAGAAALLQSVERPIVLLEKRADSGVAEEVAPENPTLGVMLPYAPLHHLLLSDLNRPLVMTSGNVSDEPIAFEDDDAAQRLGPIADHILSHDRPIASRCDDSVARVIAGVPVVLRRSRGWVPRAIPLARPVARPILACGAQLKNTFCLATGDAVFFGPHIGDLDHLEIFRAYEDAIERLTRFIGVQPELIAHDLHPEYLSTAYAQRRPEPKIAVQHHHAHIVSALMEHGLDGPALGVAWDGTGYGTDGTAWGGEFLLADRAGFRRIATLRPIRLPGGDAAIRSVWRAAAMLLDDAFDGNAPIDELRLFERVPSRQLEVIRQMAARDVNTPLAHGVGRYFDAIGALVLGQLDARFEGDVAMALTFVADPNERRPYSWALNEDTSPWELDLRPMVREIVDDLRAGQSAAVISARFHETLVCAGAQVVRRALAREGDLPVVLTGGCFQNPRLAETLRGLLTPDARVLLHSQVPPGDGGIALGQALVADALA